MSNASQLLEVSGLDAGYGASQVLFGMGLSVQAGRCSTLLGRNLDCVDGTPLLDIKPYLRTTDAEPAASLGWLAPHAGRRAAG